MVNTVWALPPALQGVIAGVGAGLAAASGPLAAAPAVLAGHRRAAAMLEVLGP